MRFFNKLVLEERVCYACNSPTTSINKEGYKRWYRHNDDWLCHKCYFRIVANPIYTPIHNPRTHRKYGPRRITYQNCRVYLSQNFRTGQCNHCHKKIGDEYINSRGKLATIKKTDMHHIEYHDDDLLQDTIELCVSCHVKETRRLKKW